MSKGIPFRQYLKEQLKNAEFKKAYDDEEVFANIAIQIAALREKRGVTQRQLARTLHTKQQAISRLESASYQGYSLGTLLKIARALGKKLQVKLV